MHGGSWEDDLCRTEDGLKDVFKAMADTIVNSPIGNSLAIEDMVSLGIDGGATDAGGRLEGG